jgi:hypothetical protein
LFLYITSHKCMTLSESRPKQIKARCLWRYCFIVFYFILIWANCINIHYSDIMFDHRPSRRFDECRRCIIIIMYCALFFMNSNFVLGILTINNQGRLFIGLGYYFKFTELSLVYKLWFKRVVPYHTRSRNIGTDLLWTDFIWYILTISCPFVT